MRRGENKKREARCIGFHGGVDRVLDINSKEGYNPVVMSANATCRLLINCWVATELWLDARRLSAIEITRACLELF